MLVKGTNYNHDRYGSVTGIALSSMLFTAIFGLSTRWHQENKLGLNISLKEMPHTTGFTVTIIQKGWDFFKISFYPVTPSQNCYNFLNSYLFGTFAILFLSFSDYPYFSF